MSGVISIFPTISPACAKTRHYCCNRHPDSFQPSKDSLICNHERQAGHFGSGQLRQVQAEEDRDPGEKPAAHERNHRTGEGGIVKPLPSCTVHPSPPTLPCFSHFLLAV